MSNSYAKFTLGTDITLFCKRLNLDPAWFLLSSAVFSAT